MSAPLCPPTASAIPHDSGKAAHETSARPLRVLLISHTCQSPTEGQPKTELIAQMPGVELVTLIPHRWKHYGQWRLAATVPAPRCRYEIGKVVWPWAGPGQFYLHWYPGLKKLLRAFQPDVIDLWEEPWALVSAHAVWLRNRFLPQCKIITETEQNIDRKLPPPFEQLRRYVCRHADHAVCRNHEAISVMRSKGFQGPATVVPNAVDGTLFRPLDRASCRQQFGFSKFTAGYIGRFVERKGIQDLIAAVAICGPDVQCVLVGSGEYEATLREQIAALALGDRVRIIPQVAPAELTPIMNAIDALVLPSRTVPTWKEQFGRVIIEAHACATPVIGSDSGAIPEVVGAGGVIVPEGDVAGLAAAMTRLSKSPEMARGMGEVGRQQVFAKYTWQMVAERMYNLYFAVGQSPRQDAQQQ